MGLAPYGEPRYVDRILDELDRPARRRVVPDEHALLRLPRRPDDDQRAASTSCSAGPPRAPESRDHPARDGPRPLDPGGDRGDRAAHGPPRRRDHGRAQRLPGRRRGAQLRGQRPAAARGPVRAHLGPARRRRRRRRDRRRAVRLAPDRRSQPRDADGGHDGMQRRVPRARSSPTTRSRATSTARATRTSGSRDASDWARRIAELVADGQGRRPVRRAAWSSARGPSATGRSSATPLARRCSRS